MPPFHRCIDQIGYCQNPETPETLKTERHDHGLDFHVLANCKYDPDTCEHHLTLAQSLDLTYSHTTQPTPASQA